MAEEDNNTGEHHIPLPPEVRHSWFERIVLRKPTSVPPDAEEKFRKRMEWIKWIGSTVIAIFVAGFGVAVWMGKFVTEDDVKTMATAHNIEHDRLSTKLETQEQLLVKIRIHQAVEQERQKLLTTQNELLLRRVRPAAIRRQSSAAAAEERSLEERIEEQQILLRNIERDPFSIEDL